MRQNSCRLAAGGSTGLIAIIDSTITWVQMCSEYI